MGVLLTSVPSPRTIGRIRKEFLALPLEVQAGYKLVRWPDSFGSPDLPWEAASDVLELIRSYPDGDYRCTVRLAWWFWRVTLAAPALDFVMRRTMATVLAERELGGQPMVNKVVKERRG